MEEQNTSQESVPEVPAAGGLGPMIGVAIILGIIVVGGVYFYGTQLQKQQEELPLILGNEPTPPAPPMPPSQVVSDVTDAEVQQLESQLEADLNALEGAL
jgi:uncharacterized protein HemX